MTGNHIYADPGEYTVTLTLAVDPGSIAGTVNGTSVTIVEPSTTATAMSAVATVHDAAIAVSAYPIAGVKGGLIPSAPIAGFVDEGGGSGNPDPASDFGANIAVVSGAGITVLSVPAAGITQEGSSDSYTVIAPPLPLATLDAGTYSLRVTVTKTVDATEVSGSGGALLVVADARLAAGARVILSKPKSLRLTTVVVGTFTDGDASAAAKDFTAVIGWGDGSRHSLGTVVSDGPGCFSVKGTHRYAHPGRYATVINVTDDGGSKVTLAGTATMRRKPVHRAGRPLTAQRIHPSRSK